MIISLECALFYHINMHLIDFWIKCDMNDIWGHLGECKIDIIFCFEIWLMLKSRNNLWKYTKSHIHSNSLFLDSSSRSISGNGWSSHGASSELLLLLGLLFTYKQFVREMFSCIIGNIIFSNIKVHIELAMVFALLQYNSEETSMKYII